MKRLPKGHDDKKILGQRIPGKGSGSSPMAFSMVDRSSGLTPSENSASPFLMSPRMVLRSTMIPLASFKTEKISFENFEIQIL
jgi:hypothetical protein